MARNVKRSQVILPAELKLQEEEEEVGSDVLDTLISVYDCKKHLTEVQPVISPPPRAPSPSLPIKWLSNFFSYHQEERLQLTDSDAYEISGSNLDKIPGLGEEQERKTLLFEEQESLPFQRKRWTANIKCFLPEVEVLKSLQHHHLMHLVGSYTDPKGFGFIMSSVPEGILGYYLKQLQEPNERKHTSVAWLRHSSTCTNGTFATPVSGWDTIITYRGAVLFTGFGLCWDTSDTASSSDAGGENKADTGSITSAPLSTA
ncbi:hypothetical protein GQ43DRAFT_429465 [Delitschia confertaspora ATCC 74209]|uniref:Uncharacterized protein n=1 Tax=Delitschia confertaspora ATCC 74209 TaxID=1513339 RepID=A0A9P4JQL1_9PLEO|nr:hypothetical protein GQ43DRAFT_429465 [Delitschia confertaspora ATCC 74209]